MATRSRLLHPASHFAELFEVFLWELFGVSFARSLRLRMMAAFSVELMPSKAFFLCGKKNKEAVFWGQPLLLCVLQYAVNDGGV